MKQKIKGWGRASQSWDQSAKGEFWWDEVGYYIYKLKPACDIETAGK